MQSKNYVLFFYSYLVIQYIFIFVHVYLPILFFTVLNVDRIALAIIQIFSYLGYAAKPIVSYYFDKTEENVPTYPLFIVSTILLCISFLLFTISIPLLVLFGLFLAINFSVASIIDALIDKYIVANSPTDKIKTRNALCIQSGSLFGAIIANLCAQIFLTDIYVRANWNLLYLTGIILILPLVVLTVFLRSEIGETKGFIYLEKESSEDESSKLLLRKEIFLAGLFVFLIYSDNLYEYPFEPWFLVRYAQGDITFLATYFMLMTLVNALGVILAGLISHKIDREKVLKISLLAYGGLTIIIPFTDLFFFTIFVILLQILAGFLLINMVSLLIEIAEGKGTSYQVIALMAVIAQAVFTALGTYLSAFLSTELIIIISGFLMLGAIIPLSLITFQEN
ncbi:MAG: hypothetical protein GF353_25730 [Candidatus Lokiarchaeota archaeon]|nr:hypothetical protein [Candidatus Lokiarchaeota archaeon]